MQTLELIIFAGLAVIVLYQLYAVLGRRVGRQPEDNPAALAAGQPLRPPEATPLVIDDGVAVSGLAAIKAKDASFDPGHFLAGSKGAYEMIVKAFAAGDREQLRSLLSPAILPGWEAAIDAREAEGRTETVEFQSPPRADLEKAELVGIDTARLTVRFLGEFRSRTKGPEGEGIEDRRTAELWTFERHLKSRDPNWLLVHVDAAEA